MVIGVLEAEIPSVEGMCKGTKGRVFLLLSEFSVNIGSRQGNVLSPLMFIMVMELVSWKVNLRGICQT